jgi:hypothetical protein
MGEIQLGDQTIRFDQVLTRTAYEVVPGGDAERCGCLYCLNFAAQRSSAYPDAFRSILEKIGIDPDKEGEVYELGPDGDSRIVGGWFYFAGEVAEAGERNSTLANFEYWFVNARRLPKPVADFGDQVAAVEFITRLPWVLPYPTEQLLYGPSDPRRRTGDIDAGQWMGSLPIGSGGSSSVAGTVRCRCCR